MGMADPENNQHFIQVPDGDALLSLSGQLRTESETTQNAKVIPWDTYVDCLA